MLYLLFVFLLVLLGACAPEQKSVGRAPTTSTQDEPPTRPLGGPAKSSDLIQIEHLPPASVGGVWLRKFVLRIPEAEGWRVERKNRSQKDFLFIGVTNSDGSFTDTESFEAAEYRFGDLYKTQEIPPARDLIWDPTLLPTQLIQAHRVIVPAGTTVEIAKRRVVIDAQIFQVEGLVQAYSPEKRGGEDAGALIVKAPIVLGKGTIRLDGMAGRSGAKGPPGGGGLSDVVPGHGVKREYADGAPGGRGWEGGPGGRGGTLEIYAKDPRLMALPQISLRGGPGGEGGEGGDGGSPGSHLMVHDNFASWQPGSRGPMGPAGNVGPVGEEGRLVLGYLRGVAE